MLTNRQVFGNHRATTGAFLCRASGVNVQHNTTGAFSLVRGVLHELTPGHIRNTSIDDTVPIRLHGRNVQVFKDDQAEAVYQLAAFLVREVGTAVRGAPVGVIERTQHLATLWRSFGMMFLLALKAGNVFCIAFHPALAGDAFARAQRGERLQTEINTHYFRRWGQGHCVHIARETGVPVTYRVAADRNCFDSAHNGAMQLEAHRADLREREPVAVQSDPVPVLRVNHAIVPAFTLEAGVTGRLTGFHAPKERLKGQVHACANFLQRLRKRRIQPGLFGFPARQHFDGVVARYACLTFFPDCFARFKSPVVDPPARIQCAQQGCALCRGRKEAVLISQSHDMIIQFMLQLHKHKARFISTAIKMAWSYGAFYKEIYNGQTV